MLSRLLCLFIVLAIVSCDKPAITYEILPFVECYDKKDFNESQLSKALNGKWQWEYVKCYWDPENANDDDCDECYLELLDNGQFIFLDKDTLIEGDYILQESFSGVVFNITTQPFVHWIVGQVYICENQLLLFDSYRDGCDNYYVRLD